MNRPEHPHGSMEQASWTYRAISQVTELAATIPGQHITTSGKKNMPYRGAAVVAPAHHNSHDVSALGHTVYKETGRPMHFVTKEELLENRFSGPILRRAHGLPFTRGETKREQIISFLQVLKDQQILAIFPEGERIDGREIKTPIKSIGRIAVAEGAPIIVAAVAGPNRRRKHGKKVGKPRVWLPRPMHVHFDTPIITEGLNKFDAKDLDAEVTDRMQQSLETAYEFFELYNGPEAAAQLD